ncbi:MAG: winged helix-turn-helix domain-containing protein [Pseudomonadota bacterium]
MEIYINKTYPIGIKEQIKRQIKTKIELGHLAVGDRLPSANVLGQHLNINRNTVALAYKELEQTGFVSISKGSGTFVQKISTPKKNQLLKGIFNQAYELAMQSDFTHEDISNFFITGLLENSQQRLKGGKAIFIDCNYEVLKTLDKKIKQECDIDSHFMLIQDIEKMPEKFIKRAREYDFIFCGMNHLKELHDIAPGLTPQIMGFLIKTDVQLIHQIMALPEKTNIGYCCLTPKSAQAFFQNLVISKKTATSPIFSGISEKNTIKEMTTQCDIIFATHYVYNTLLKKYPDHKNIQKVDLVIDPDSLKFIISLINRGAV